MGKTSHRNRKRSITRHPSRPQADPRPLGQAGSRHHRSRARPTTSRRLRPPARPATPTRRLVPAALRPPARQPRVHLPVHALRSQHPTRPHDRDRRLTDRCQRASRHIHRQGQNRDDQHRAVVSGQDQRQRLLRLPQRPGRRTGRQTFPDQLRQPATAPRALDVPTRGLQPLLQIAESATPTPLERHRRLASWIVWTTVTGGEPSFAPPTILPANASKTRTALINDRHIELANHHYRSHLDNYARQLARDIDADSHKARCMGS